jgi:hypothetical protein
MTSRAGDDDAGVARIEEWRMIPAGDDDAERLRAMRTKRERRA